MPESYASNVIYLRAGDLGSPETLRSTVGAEELRGAGKTWKDIKEGVVIRVLWRDSVEFLDSKIIKWDQVK